MQKNFFINNESELVKVADYLSKNIKLPAVLMLFGDLGSGKTTFAKYFSQSLGVKDRITSPTFLICKNYKISKNSEFVHYDLYRLNNFAELEEIGLSDYLGGKNIIYIEWADKIKNLEQNIKHINQQINIYKLYFNHTHNINKRKIKIIYE